MPLPSVPVALRMFTSCCSSDAVMLCSTTPVLLVTWSKFTLKACRISNPDGTLSIPRLRSVVGWGRLPGRRDRLARGARRTGRNRVSGNGNGRTLGRRRPLPERGKFALRADSRRAGLTFQLDELVDRKSVV